MSSDHTTTVEQRGTTATLGTLRVEVVAGPSAGATTMFDADAITVGSAARNALTVADPLVSRIHLELVRTPDAIRVTDLGSTNGTFANGNRITSVRLFPGMTIRLGSTEVRFWQP